MNYLLFKDFIRFIVEADVQKKEELIEEIGGVCSQVSHIIIQREIFPVTNLLAFATFGKVWTHYNLLRRLHEYCLASGGGSNITNCTPMEVIGLPFQFIILIKYNDAL